MKNKIELIKKEHITRSILALIACGLSFLFDKIILNIVGVIQHPLLFKFFYTITLLGETYVFIFIALILIAALMIYKRPITEFILTIFTAEIILVVIKLLVNRPRPFEASDMTSSIITHMSSFPSGHTLMFFSIIPILSKNFPKIKTLFWTIATLVGLSRIYLGVHYFSDVICGAVLGYSIGWIYMKAGERYAWKY